MQSSQTFLDILERSFLQEAYPFGTRTARLSVSFHRSRAPLSDVVHIVFRVQEYLPASPQHIAMHNRDLRMICTRLQAESIARSYTCIPEARLRESMKHSLHIHGTCWLHSRTITLRSFGRSLHLPFTLCVISNGGNSRYGTFGRAPSLLWYSCNLFSMHCRTISYF